MSSHFFVTLSSAKALRCQCSLSAPRANYINLLPTWGLVCSQELILVLLQCTAKVLSILANLLQLVFLWCIWSLQLSLRVCGSGNCSAHFLCFSRSLTLMQRQIPVFPPPSPPIHVNRVNWSNHSSAQCLDSLAQRLGDYWQVDNHTAKLVSSLWKFICYSFHLMESPCLSIFYSSSQVTEQPSTVLFCRAIRKTTTQGIFPQSLPDPGAPTWVILSEMWDPSGGRPEAIIRLSNSLNSSFQIYQHLNVLSMKNSGNSDRASVPPGDVQKGWIHGV